MGRDKARLPCRRGTLLQAQRELLSRIAGEVLVGAREADAYSDLGIDCVPDRLAEPCALSGLHALLAAARHEHLLALAVDLPFLHPGLLTMLADRRREADVVLPVGARGPEPLHAIYSKRCVAAIEAAAARGDWKATGFHDDVRVLEIPVREADWLVDGRSPFTNANTPEDWAEVGEIS
jgi:molybdopterin-guanine dinucleotide biosynthesis protein A